MRNKKRLGISVVANMISMCVSLGISFLLTPFLIRSIGKEAYSFFPLSNNFVTYMTIATSALNSMASRFITVSITGGKETEAKKYFSSVFYSNIIMAAALLIPMMLIVVYVDRLLDIPAGLERDVRLLFVFVFAAMLISLISSVFSIATFARERLDLSALQSIIQNVLRAGILIALFSLLKPHIVYMGFVVFLMSIYNAGINYYYTRRLLPEYRVDKRYIDEGSILVLLKSGVWNSVSNLGSTLLLTISLLMANTMLGASAGGDISIIQTLPNFMTTVISTIFTVLLSHITVVYSEGDKFRTKDAVIDSQKILGLIATVPAVIIVICGRTFFSLWVPGENADYLQMLSIITILPLILHSTMWTVYGLNIVNNRVKRPAIVFLLTGCANLAVTYAMLKTTNFGLIVIPIVSTVCSIAYYLAFIPTYAAKQMDLPAMTFYPHIAKSGVLTILLILVFTPLVNMLHITDWISFFMVCGTIEVIGIAMYLFIVLNRVDRIRIKRLLINQMRKDKPGD